MFNWLKRKYKSKSTLTNWGIEDIDGFERHQNVDSVQYTNADNSKVIYFSILTTSGGEFLTANAPEPTIIEDDNGWQLKGMKTLESQILICVISVIKQEDLEWAKAFFSNVKPVINSN